MGFLATEPATDAVAALGTPAAPRCLTDITLLSKLYIDAESDISSPASIADPKNASQLNEQPHTEHEGMGNIAER